MLNYESFSLRPIEPDDKDRILEWRNSERVRSNMYSDHVISQQEHDAWYGRALVDTTAAFFLFLYEGRPIGFVSFTGINRQHGRCSWAFYLGETDVPRGAGAAMEFIALDYAFLTLKIRKLCAEVFTFNSGVIRLHEKFGFVHEGKFVEHYAKNGKYEDIVCLAKFGVTWPAERETFKIRCFGKKGLNDDSNRK